MSRFILLLVILTAAANFCPAEISNPISAVQCQNLQPVARYADFAAVEPGNAAVCYARAFELMQYPQEKDLSEKLYQIVKNGWLQESKELESVLDANSACLKKFIVGTSFADCDFTFGKPPKYLIERKANYESKGFNLSLIALLKGRHFEKLADFENAARYYLSALILAHHFGLDRYSGSQSVAVIIEYHSIKPLRDLVAGGNLDPKTVSEIREFLEAYEKSRVTKRIILETLRDEDKSAFHMMADKMMTTAADLHYRHPENTPPGLLKYIAGFRVNFRLIADEEIDYMYGNVIRAVETGSPKDWAFSKAEAEKRDKIGKKLQKRLKDPDHFYADCLATYVQKHDTRCIREAVYMLGAGTVPVPSQIFKQFDQSLLELSSTRSLAEERLQGLKKN